MFLQVIMYLLYTNYIRNTEKKIKTTSNYQLEVGTGLPLKKLLQALPVL